MLQSFLLEQLETKRRESSLVRLDSYGDFYRMFQNSFVRFEEVRCFLKEISLRLLVHFQVFRQRRLFEILTTIEKGNSVRRPIV